MVLIRFGRRFAAIGLTLTSVLSLGLAEDIADEVFEEKPPAINTPAKKQAPSKKNRLTYVSYQTLLSTYVYGLSIPLAYGVDNPRVLIAAPLIAAPLAFGAHLWLSSSIEMQDSHLKGMMYMPTLGVYAATVLPIAFNEKLGSGFKIGSILGSVAYPLSLWYGHYLGDVYRQSPNQLDTKFRFALGYAFLGFITPSLYFEHPDENTKDIIRIGFGQSVGFAALGHIVADFYQPSLRSASGIPLGITTHAILGGLAGIGVAALNDAASIRPWSGAAVLGTTLGFTEGVFFFYKGRDSKERSLYSALGSVGGALMGAGIQLLLYDKNATNYEQKTGWSGYVIGGAWLGYIATYALTMSMLESENRTENTENSKLPHWAFNPIPSMEAVESYGEWVLRWKVPGYSFQF